VAGRLAGGLGLPVVHLDEHYYRAGWEPLSMAEWRSVHDRLVAGTAWVMDGNYRSTLPVRLRASDAVVFLDLPRLMCLWRVLVRRLRWLGRRAPGMADGCVERLDRRTPQFLRYVWRYPRTMRPEVLSLLAEHAHGAQVVHLTSRAQVRRFLADLR
jgi:adenylate kinase family enzyme